MIQNRPKHRRGLPRPYVNLTQSRLKEVLSYDADTGLFTWIKRISIRVKVGSTAGCPCPRGYIRITIDGEMFNAHRLAWFYSHGSWPLDDLDHEARDPSNNRMSNLRPATRSQNNGNSKTNKRNIAGLKGVSWRPNRCAYLARINVNKRSICLGYFKTKEAAHSAYLEAANIHFGEFANSGSIRSAA